VIILSAVAWFTFYSYQKVIGDLAIKQDREIVQTKMAEFASAISEMISTYILPVYMEIDPPNDAPLEVRVQNILDNIPDLDIFDGGIYFLDQEGKVFKSEPEQPELFGMDWSNIPQFRFIQEHPNAAAITDLRDLGSSGKKIFCVTVAMTNLNAEFIGAGYYCFTIFPVTQNVYYQAANRLDLGPNFYVMDRNQLVIFSTDSSEIGKEVSGRAYIQQLLQGESKSGRFRIGNEDRLVSYIPVSSDPDGVSWIVFNERSWGEIMQPTRAYRQLLLVLLALGVIIPVLVSAYGVRYITDPIEKLIQATEQVTAGQFKQRIEVKTGDEIETLADQFNLMSAKLDDSYSSLEKKVADRTRELAIMNSIISVASQSLDIQEILEDALNKTVEQMGFEAGAAFKLESDPTTSLLITYRGFERTTALDLVNIDPFTSQVNTADHQSTVTTFVINDLQDDCAALAQSGYQILFVPSLRRDAIWDSLSWGSGSGRFPPKNSLCFDWRNRCSDGDARYEQAEQSRCGAALAELHDRSRSRSGGICRRPPACSTPGYPNGRRTPARAARHI
jgi:HAMP domain-containing protein